MRRGYPANRRFPAQQTTADSTGVQLVERSTRFQDFSHFVGEMATLEEKCVKSPKRARCCSNVCAEREMHNSNATNVVLPEPVCGYAEELSFHCVRPVALGLLEVQWTSFDPGRVAGVTGGARLARADRSAPTQLCIYARTARLAGVPGCTPTTGANQLAAKYLAGALCPVLALVKGAAVTGATRHILIVRGLLGVMLVAERYSQGIAFGEFFRSEGSA